MVNDEIKINDEISVTLNDDHTGTAYKSVTMNMDEYEVIDEVKLDDDFGFRMVKFDNGYYGITYWNPEEDFEAVVMVTTDASDAGPDAFMRFAKLPRCDIDISQADKVELHLQLDDDDHIYREVISGEAAETLLEKLEIAREIEELKRENKWNEFDRIWLLTMIVMVICIVANALSAIHNIGGI